MIRSPRGVGLVLIILASTLVACNTSDQHGSATQENSILDGKYWYVNFSRAVTTTIQPDLEARVGLAQADGEGKITFGPNVGSPLPASERAFVVNTMHQIDNTSNHPGATLAGGEFFELGDLDRNDGNNIGLMLLSKHGDSMTVNDLIDSGATSGFYHAVLLRFNRPGVLTGTGNATLTKNTNTTASWRIDYTLSTSTTLSRQGSMLLAPDGAITSNDVTTGRTYFGFGEPNGDWIVWMEASTTANQIYRMDILIRKGKSLSKASLNGRLNLLGFYQESATENVDALFGRMAFDGQGQYYDFTTRNSFGNSSTSGNQTYPYDVASDGRVTFLGGVNPVGYITRSKDRRWLIFPDVNPSGTLGFFIALAQ